MSNLDPVTIKIQTKGALVQQKKLKVPSVYGDGNNKSDIYQQNNRLCAFLMLQQTFSGLVNCLNQIDKSFSLGVQGKFSDDKEHIRPI